LSGPEDNTKEVRAGTPGSYCGRYGLFFIDGNADFFQPEAEPNGEGASMDLAFVTGHGPSLLSDIEGLGPLVRPEDAVALMRTAAPGAASSTYSPRHSVQQRHEGDKLRLFSGAARRLLTTDLGWWFLPYPNLNLDRDYSTMALM
jgi:hypothetical protein